MTAICTNIEPQTRHYLTRSRIRLTEYLCKMWRDENALSTCITISARTAPAIKTMGQFDFSSGDDEVQGCLWWGREKRNDHAIHILEKVQQ